MKVTVDLRLCQGYVCCVMEAPEVFDVNDEEGKAIVLVDSPEETLRDKVKTAERSCPSRAITVDG
jgi:ferredoxin